MSSLIDNKSKNKLLSEFETDYKPPAAKEYQILKEAIFVKCTEDIENSIIKLDESINKTAESNQNLAKKVYWLNIILAAATSIGTIFAILKFFCDLP